MPRFQGDVLPQEFVSKDRARARAIDALLHGSFRVAVAS